MLFKKKPKEDIDLAQHEMLENAHYRIKQKKRLYSHFVVFLIGCVAMILANKAFKYGEAYDWYLWGIAIWSLLLFYHILNVYVIKAFLGRDWERQQRERLVKLQKDKIAQIQKEIETEFPLSKINQKEE